MGRTQVYLGERELELLERAASACGASRSELIRRAIRSTFGEGRSTDRVAVIRRTSGLWKDRKFTGATYVDGLRGDLNLRLSRLGLE